LALAAIVFLASLGLVGYYLFGPELHLKHAAVFGGLAILSLVAANFARNWGPA
jgi:hypothetical protein